MTNNLETLNIGRLLKLYEAQNRGLIDIISKTNLSLEKVINIIVKSISCGGKVLYVGAGTSGRLGVLDASELPPTFGIKPMLFRALIAGGKKAITKAVEGAEDNKNQAIIDLRANKISKKDVVLGITASGTTPYTISALNYAKQIGAKTILFSCGIIPKNSKYDVTILIKTGEEFIEGSTRLNAGTVQKIVLNMISTITMIKLGKTFGRLMVDVQATNVKLKKRAQNILANILKVSQPIAKRLLERTNYNIKEAVLMYKLKISQKEAKKLLVKNRGFLREYLKF